MWDDRGPRAAAAEGVDFVSSLVGYPFARQRRDPGSFRFCGRDFRYVRHWYNRAWRNERSVELALANWFLENHSEGNILEVGNVLAHYRPVHHVVVDKYEQAPGVTNDDVVDHRPDAPYDLILAISTLEHVGWDERPREPEKVRRAFEHLGSLLCPGGSMVVTCPFGHNAYLDELLLQDAFDIPIKGYLRRISQDNRWEEASLAEVTGARYGTPYRNANALFVGIVDGQGRFA